MNRSLAIIIIIIFNSIPIIGAAYYHWSPFEMFWLFWVETLVIGFFNAIRVLYSQGHAQNEAFQQGNIQYNKGRALKYFTGRIAVFLFYSIFIIVFIGFIANQKENKLHVFQTIFFQNLLFNLAIALSIASQAFYLIKYFFANRGYYYSMPNQYPALFDGRQIVIHVAVVVGAVGSAFLFKNSNTSGYAAIWIMGVFCITKCIFDLIVNSKPAINP